MRLLPPPEQAPANKENTKDRNLAQPHRRKYGFVEKRSARGSPASQDAQSAASARIAGETVRNDESPFSLPTPVPGAGTLIENAKRDVGKIDRELRREHPKMPQAVPDSVQAKLARGIAAAAKRNWTSAATTEEIFSSGGTGRRMYRITTPAGVYCVTYESDSAAAGVDTMQHGIQQIIGTCPK